MMRVSAVGTEYTADALGDKSVIELCGLPKFGRDLGRGNELIP
jgi:hypothetical protein